MSEYYKCEYCHGSGYRGAQANQYQPAPTIGTWPCEICKGQGKLVKLTWDGNTKNPIAPHLTI